jgi:hypothetical protein
VDQALIGALTQLVTVLQALVQALQAQQQLAAAGPTTGGGPVQSPVQSPIQAPPAKGGGPAVPAASAPSIVGGGGTAATVAPTPIAQTTGARVGVSRDDARGNAMYHLYGGETTSTSVSFAPGASSTFTGSNRGNTVMLAGGDRSIPDAGSVRLSTGASVSWTTTKQVDPAVSYITSNHVNLTVTPAGGAPIGFHPGLDTPGVADTNYANPLTAAEQAELAQLLASSYPLAPR